MTEVISRCEQGIVGNSLANHVVEVGWDLPEMILSRLKRLRRTAAACGCLSLASMTLAAANARSSSEQPPGYTPAPLAIQRDFPVPVRCYETVAAFYIAQGRDPNDLKNNPRFSEELLAGFSVYGVAVGFSPAMCTALKQLEAKPIYIDPLITAQVEFFKIHELKHATLADTIPDPVCKEGDVECQADCQTAKTYSKHLYQDGFRGRYIFNLLTFFAQRYVGYNPQKTRRCWPVWLTKEPVERNVPVTAKLNPEPNK